MGSADLLQSRRSMTGRVTDKILAIRTLLIEGQSLDLAPWAEQLDIVFEDTTRMALGGASCRQIVFGNRSWNQ